VAERPWREVLATWWPRLLHGIAAGATHGVIKFSDTAAEVYARTGNADALAAAVHASQLLEARG
jgi:hypothetical protein